MRFEISPGVEDHRGGQPHAVRVLARAGVYVIWRCRYDGLAYEPGRHGALQRRARTRAGACIVTYVTAPNC